jgi:GNAT superfamily N-acetyltransferase
MHYPAVRRAASDDRERLGELWLALLDEQAGHDDRLAIADDALERWRNDFPVWLEDETRRLYVAEDDHEIVGFASAHRWGPPPIYEDSSEVYLDEVFVVPDARRSGYGSQLVDAVVDWTDRLNARRIRLSVLDANDAARAFWEAQDGVPFTVTYSIERPGNQDDASREGSDSENEGSKKIGFR